MAKKKRRFIVTFDLEQMNVNQIRSKELAHLLPRACSSPKNAMNVQMQDKAARGATLNFREFGIVSVALTDRQAAELNVQKFIRDVQRDRSIAPGPLSSPAVPAIRSFDQPELMEADDRVPENIRDVNADKVWRITRGTGTRIGVVDSGIELEHADLKAGITKGRSFHPDTESTNDIDGHGTRAAGVIGARENNTGIVGVAPECELIPLKVTHRKRGRASFVVAALQWALHLKLDAVNISLSAPAGTADERPWAGIHQAAAKLMDAGCLVVASAGNDGDEHPGHWVGQPARSSNIIAVGSIGKNGKWIESSYGPPTLTPQEGVELVAPGQGVFTTLIRGGAGEISGSSFSAPHVTGAAALLKSLDCQMSSAEIRRHLMASASPVAAEFHEQTGFGRLDCLSAVKRLSSGPLFDRVDGMLNSVTRDGPFIEARFHPEAILSVAGESSESSDDKTAAVRFRVMEQADLAMLTSSIGHRVVATGRFGTDRSGLNRVEATTLTSLQMRNGGTARESILNHG